MLHGDLYTSSTVFDCEVRLRVRMSAVTRKSSLPRTVFISMHFSANFFKRTAQGDFTKLVQNYTLANLTYKVNVVI